MTRTLVILGAVLALASCGGGSRGYNPGGGSGGGAVLFAAGPINTACLRSDRKRANRARCGCIQAVADRELTDGYQRRGAKLFSDPHLAQEIRQSDTTSNERFWREWKEFGNTASTLCAAT